MNFINNVYFIISFCGRILYFIPNISNFLYTIIYNTYANKAQNLQVNYNQAL